MSQAKRILLKAAAGAARILPASFKHLLYRIPFLSKIVRRSLNAAAPKGLNEVEIAAGILRGMRMSLNLQTEKDYWLGTYELDLQEAARRLIQPGMTIYDVGANIGYISLIAARLTGEKGSVFSFEALPKNIERLKGNVQLNKLKSQINVIHAAVTDTTGEAVFLAHESGAMGKALGSAGREAQYAAELRVPAVALDDFVYRDGNLTPQVVKMDIEGGEGMALQGMRRILEETHPVLMIELHGQEAASQVWEILGGVGYTIHTMSRGMPKVNSLDELDWKAYIVAKRI